MVTTSYPSGDRRSPGLEDAIAFSKGAKTRGRVRKVRASDVDVAATRGKLGLSQEQFAAAFGVSLGTVRNWEQGRRTPDGPALVLLTVIEKSPARSCAPSGARTAESGVVEFAGHDIGLMESSMKTSITSFLRILTLVACAPCSVALSACSTSAAPGPAPLDARTDSPAGGSG